MAVCLAVNGDAWAPRPDPRLRPRWSDRQIALAGLALETTVLVAFVAAAAGGVFQGRAEAMPLPIPLGWRDAPALIVVGAHVALRGQVSRALARAERLPAWLRAAPPFVPFATAVVAISAAAHPDPARGVVLSFLAGLLVGLILSVFGMPMADFAASLDGPEARPWRELHVASTLATLGTLACAARGGLVVSAPTAVFGVALLARGLRHDLGDLLRGRTSRVAAIVRLLVGGAFALLGVGLAIVSSGISLGFIRTPG